MLNTCSVKKVNNNTHNNHDFSIIQDSINQINENNDEPQYDAIAQSFHLKEKQIFGSIHPEPHNDNTVIKNFNLEEITQKYANGHTNPNIFDDDKQLMITINEKLNKLSVYEKAGNLIGFFTLEHIIKYLGDSYDTKKQFMKDIDNNIYPKAKELIKLLIFKIKYNKVTNYTDILLFDYTQSGFMGDIELLIKLNNMLYNYQQNNMSNDLSKVELHNRNKIELNIKKFIIMLLNYTLKLISYVSQKIQHAEKMDQVKKYLLEYSVDIVYKINLFIQEQLKIIDNQNKSIKNTLDANIEIKNHIKQKLDKLVNNLEPIEKKSQKILPIPAKYQNLNPLMNKQALYSLNEH